MVLRVAGEPSIARRAEWLHRSCRLVLRRLRFDLRVAGELPTTGLIASNHLTYLDILFYGATLPLRLCQHRGAWVAASTLAALGGTCSSIEKRGERRVRAPPGSRSCCRGRSGSGFSRRHRSRTVGVLWPVLLLFGWSRRCELRARATAAAIGYPQELKSPNATFCYYGEIPFAPQLLETLQLPISSRRCASRRAIFRPQAGGHVDARGRWFGVVQPATNGAIRFGQQERVLRIALPGIFSTTPFFPAFRMAFSGDASRLTHD